MLASPAGASCLVLRSWADAPSAKDPFRPDTTHEVPGTACVRSLERETGIEPATNSLEGCDSTTELLPPISIQPQAQRRAPSLPAASADKPPPAFLHLPHRRAAPRKARLAAKTSSATKPSSPLAPSATRFGGEGRVRTSVATRAADLQSAAIDRSATSPKLHSWTVNLALRPQLDASEARSLGSGSCHVLEFVYSALP